MSTHTTISYPSSECRLFLDKPGRLSSSRAQESAEVVIRLFQVRHLSPLLILLLAFPGLKAGVPLPSLKEYSLAPVAPLHYAAPVKALEREHFFVPGNSIRIVTFPDTTRFPSGIYPIDDLGYVFLPSLGKVRVLELTVTELEERLKKEYINYLNFPFLAIRPLIRISLLGGFRSPGLYWVDPSHSLWDLLKRAGGPIRDDGLKKILWERSRSLISRDLIPHIENGTSLQGAGFRSGDQLRLTGRSRRNFSEVIREDLLPFLSLTASMVSLGTSIYFSYQAYRSR